MHCNIHKQIGRQSQEQRMIMNRMCSCVVFVICADVFVFLQCNLSRTCYCVNSPMAEQHHCDLISQGQWVRSKVSQSHLQRLQLSKAKQNTQIETKHSRKYTNLFTWCPFKSEWSGWTDNYNWWTVIFVFFRQPVHTHTHFACASSAARQWHTVVLLAADGSEGDCG